MKKPVKLAAALLAGLMLVFFTACVSNGRPQEETPTEAPASEMPSAESSAEPSEEPTETPDLEPTEVPEPMELAFDDCAEEIIRLAAGKGAEDNYYYYPQWDEPFGPSEFQIEDGFLYFRTYMDLFRISLESGKSERVAIVPNSGAPIEGQFGVLDGSIVTNGGVIDFNTGTVEKVIPAAELTFNLLSVMKRGGKLYANVYVEGVWDDSELVSAPHIDEYLYFPEEKAWIASKRLIDCIPEPDNEISHQNYEYVYTDTGLPAAGGANGYRIYMNEYDRVNERFYYTVSKYSRDGSLLSWVDLPFNELEMFDETAFLECSDGFVYVMAKLPDEIVIYRLNM